MPAARPNPPIRPDVACLILAAGKGTRMNSARSKVLHEVLGKPLISYPVERAAELGASPIIAVLGHQLEAVQKELLARHGEGAVTVVEQAEQKGTGHAVKLGLQPLGAWEGIVVILYGDVPLLRRQTLGALIDEAVKTGGLSMLSARVPDPAGYGRVVRDGQGRVVRIVEHKDASPAERQIDEINAGIYAAPAAFLREAVAHLVPQNAQGEYYLTDIVERAAGSIGAAAILADHQEVAGINDRRQLAECERVLCTRLVDRWLEHVTFRDPGSVWIEPDVVIEPDVELGRNVALRGKTKIGRGARIDDGVILEDAVVGEGTEVLAYSVVRGTELRAGATIGPRAVLPSTTGAAVATSSLDERLRALRDRGVTIIDPRQTYVHADVDLDRIAAGVVLHPGTRLLGSRSLLGPGAIVGSEGPAVLENAVLGERAEVASGILRDSVLLRGARIGANGHVRAGTLLEEEASTAHAVGLKHTVLMSFVTLGSLINLCDALVAGGTSRRNHTEIGSGFIHFNFTPWGDSGDKATPSLIGDVARGVFLRERRIFLGGLSGLVGPGSVGFGAVSAAGQVIRHEVGPGRLFADAPRAIDREWDGSSSTPPARRIEKNVRYIGQLLALREWYRQVRLPSSAEHHLSRIVLEEAIRLIDSMIEERTHRLKEFAAASRLPDCRLVIGAIPVCPLEVRPAQAAGDHIAWVRGLSAQDVSQGIQWMESVARRVECTVDARE
jgi:UDP-N-acetylglucosamine diphosphorylase/glucosamine-1-phosphate N-acetyltransferase